MFVSRIKTFYKISDKIIKRNLRNSRLTRVDQNPGLSKRINVFQKSGVQVEENNADEFIEMSASDFSKAGEVYNEHLNETLIGKHELRHQIVRDKYFKENMPNLLTWSEKEQIRHLAQTAPDEWTPEKLADSFPITEITVKKLLKYPWKPATKERIQRHDASVMRNWKELEEGTLSISEGLRQHFLKFSKRTIPPLDMKSLKIDVTQKQKMGEFERIVQRCAAKEESSNSSFTKDESNNKKISKHHKDSKRVTLDELKENIQNSLDKGKALNLNDEIIINTAEITLATDSHPVNKEVELYEGDDKNQLTEFKENNEEKNKNIEYPERIRIPKKAYKKGATYKVNDCYYDHDGRFLYRVLGMSN